MSLGKTYFVTCESRSLAHRLGRDDLLNELLRECRHVSLTEISAAKARSSARKLGWSRPNVRVPIGRHSAMIRFDLCRTCTKIIAERIGELPS